MSRAGKYNYKNRTLKEIERFRNARKQSGKDVNKRSKKNGDRKHENDSC